MVSAIASDPGWVTPSMLALKNHDDLLLHGMNHAILLEVVLGLEDDHIDRIHVIRLLADSCPIGLAYLRGIAGNGRR